MKLYSMQKDIIVKMSLSYTESSFFSTINHENSHGNNVTELVTLSFKSEEEIKTFWDSLLLS